MDSFSSVTTGPFDAAAYRDVYNSLKWRSIFRLLVLFFIIQFVLVQLPQILLFPRNIGIIWKATSHGIASYLKNESFTHVSWKDGKLETDLATQPYTFSRQEGQNTTLLSIDSTEKTTADTIAKLPATTTGIFITQTALIIRESTTKTSTYTYKNIIGNTEYSVSKDALISFLSRDDSFSTVIHVLTTPQYFPVVLLLAGYIVFSYIWGQATSLLAICFIFATLAFVMIRNSPLKKFGILYKLSIFPAIGFWYITTVGGILVSYLPQTGGWLLPLIYVISFFSLMSILLRGLHLIGRQVDRTAVTTSPKVVTPVIHETQKQHEKSSVYQYPASHIGRHFKTKKIKNRRSNVR